MKREEINIRDPFVLVHEGKYYMYGTAGKDCWNGAGDFNVYVGDDLENFSEPICVFRKSEDFWATKNFWAPEVHFWNGKFYMFASFKSEQECRGTQILVADSPTGTFVPISERPVTPRNWECLDGTFYSDKNGNPYIVFCHEWVQVKDGEICAMQLSKDLKAAVSEPKVLFRASEAPWARPIRDGKSFVTDGPFLYRNSNNKLLMLWSGFGEEGYTQGIALSDNDDITGNWIHMEEPLFKKDGGHGMLFRGRNGVLYLTLHAPNTTEAERPAFFEVFERGDSLCLERE